MYRDVYIGYFEKGFDHIGDPYEGNSPFRISPFFPGFSSHYFKLKERIADGAYDGRKVDWGAWAARVTKKQIIEFIDEEYGESPFTGAYDGHLRKEYEALISFVKELSTDDEHYLVASSI